MPKRPPYSAAFLFLLGLFGFFALGFPIFISSCCFGFIRTRAPIRRLVSSRSDFFVMPPRKPKPPKPPRELLPWEIRPSSPMGDRDPQILFAAIGASLTEWERIEASCAEIFAVLVSARGKSTYWTPAIQAYGSIISFKSRCDMLRAAAKSFFHVKKTKKAEFETLFDALIEEANNYSGRRNEIAHGQVTEMYAFLVPGGTKSLGYYLYPSLFNPKKFKLGGFATYTYVSSDIIHYRQEFTKLHLRMEGFRRELTGRKPPTSLGKPA